jgi:copper homeostasis protein
VQLAEQAGAQRVELCNGFSVGGTTVTIGCLQEAKMMSTIPIFVMIRPRGGNFTYTKSEKNVMLKDAALAIENKADGIVFGALNTDGTIDKLFCEEMCKLGNDIDITFHRAIDLCSNTEAAIDFLFHCGVQTILTSGAESTAVKGIEQIKNWNNYANGRLNIMAGSGVNAENILQFAAAGLTHFHSSASEIINFGNTNNKIGFNASLRNEEVTMVSKTKVKRMIEKLNSYF